MRSQENEWVGAEFAPLEQLLSDAAAWEPDVPAPAGLAGRVMAAELERQGRERTLRGRERRAGLFATFFMGASAVSATVALAFFNLSPRLPTMAPAGSAGTTVARAEVTPAPPTTPSAPQVKIAPPLPRVRPSVHRRTRRLAGTALPRRRVEKKATEAPAAIWREETVRHEVAGVLSSGWLIRQNTEDGSFTITPGVLDLQTGTQEACGDATPASEGLAVPPPLLPQPSAPLEPVTETLNAPNSTPASTEERGVPPVPES